MKKIFSILGKVVKGKDKGRRLGYPTANINLAKDCQIKSGVYPVRAHWPGKDLEGVAFIRSNLLEVYLFDFEGDLYEKKIKVDFFKKLREARKFKNDQELKEQIKKDCQLARKFLKSI